MLCAQGWLSFTVFMRRHTHAKSTALASSAAVSGAARLPVARHSMPRKITCGQQVQEVQLPGVQPTPL